MQHIPHSANASALHESQGRSTSLVPDLKSEMGRRQLAETSRSIPVLLLFHFSAVAAISAVVSREIPRPMLWSWQFATIVVALIFYGFFSKLKPRVDSERRDRQFLNALPFLGLFLALVWAAPALMFTPYVNGDADIIVFGASLAMMGVGVTCLLRVPATAILYSSFLAVVIGQSLYVGLGNHQIVAAIISLMFGLAFIGIISLVHKEFTRRTEIELNGNRQGEIIKLLLNDFERDTSDWLWETKLDGSLAYFSPRLASVLGRAPEQMIGKNLFALMRDDNNSDHIDSLRDLTLRQSEILNYVLPLDQQGAKQYFQITARPLFDVSGDFLGYRGVGRDVTSQHDSEEQIRAAKESAERASAAKSQFLAVISHELRTPINAIVGFSEVLNAAHSENLPAASRKDYLNTVLESAKHLQGLINDILDATRIERGAFHLSEQENDAAELVEVAIKICRDQAATANISIVAHVAEDVNLMGDMTRLKQVILNLLTNAIKFSPAGGVVNIDMQCGAERQLIISIRDAGIGISAEDALLVFEPFVQADGSITRQYGGMGLGLSIARRIARMHGGDVTLEGERGVGTDARLILPSARVRWPQKYVKPASMVAA
jgi:PAS domain S-box-containing protein